MSSEPIGKSRTASPTAIQYAKRVESLARSATETCYRLCLPKMSCMRVFQTKEESPKPEGEAQLGRTVILRVGERRFSKLLYVLATYDSHFDRTSLHLQISPLQKPRLKYFFLICGFGLQNEVSSLVCSRSIRLCIP